MARKRCDAGECQRFDLERRVALLEKALKPFSVYAEKRDAQPLIGMGETVHSIHFGSPHAAEITMEHCRAARELLKATDQ